MSERKFYQKITDIYATSLDYDHQAPATVRFYTTVQNKLHYAIHGHTAAELIVKRAHAEKEHMGPDLLGRRTIQTDGYDAYDQFESDHHIQVLNCWARARRKWVDALDEDKHTASEAMAYINKLYHIENEAKDAGLSYDELRDKRQKEAYPVILEFEKWMYETARKSSEQSRIGKAIKYTLPLMPRLGRYVNDGRFCIDKNLVENAVRPLALGRKNFLFCGNHDAAVRAAIVYSLMSSCKAMGVDPREWMEDVMLRIPGNENNRGALRDCVFIGIDSNCIKENDTEREEVQWDWLSQELAVARSAKGVRHIFLFLHCPIVRESLEEPEDYFNFPFDKRTRYINLLKEYGVEAVFAGHTHCDYQTTLDGITFYTANPSGNTLGHGRTGIYRVEVNKKGIEVTFVPTTDD